MEESHVQIRKQITNDLEKNKSQLQEKIEFYQKENSRLSAQNEELQIQMVNMSIPKLNSIQ